MDTQISSEHSAIWSKDNEKMVAQTPDFQAQVREVIRACGGVNSFVGTNPRAVEWLMSLTSTDTPTPCAEQLDQAFLLQVHCYDTSPGPVTPTSPASVYQSLIMPHESFAGGRGMLGRAYARMLPGFFDGVSDSMVLEHQEVGPGHIATLVHCVADLRRGIYYEVQRTRNNGLMVAIIAAGLRDAAIVMQSVMIDASGNVELVLDGRPICQFCDAKCEIGQHFGECSCPESLRARTTGWSDPVTVTSWSSYRQLARRNIDGGLLMSRPSYGTSPDEMPGRHQVFLLVDGRIIDECRASFVDYVTLIGRSMDSRIINMDFDDALIDFGILESPLDDVSLGSLFGADSDRKAALALQDTSHFEGNESCKVGKHVKARVGRTKVICPFCNAVFAKFANMKRHITTVHEQRREFNCSQCDSSFTQLGNLRRHEAAVHAKIKAWTCSLCSLTFGSNANYQRHLKTKRHIRALGTNFEQGVTV